MTPCPCPACQGQRLRPEALAVTVGGKSIYDATTLPVDDALAFFDHLDLTGNQQIIAAQILKEIHARLGFLQSVGLSYLTLSRASGTLSGGESQRIRLATQIGSSLMGVLYILDEPSIGLHQRDNDWPRCSASAIWAIPSSWWSTTRTPCAPPITLLTSVPAPAPWAGRWWPAALRRKSWRTLTA